MLAEPLAGVRSLSSSSLIADRSGGALPAGGVGVAEDMVSLAEIRLAAGLVGESRGMRETEERDEARQASTDLLERDGM